MNLSVSLTLLRILFVPVLVVLLLSSQPNADLWAAGVFLLSATTDLLDGYFARQRSQITTLLRETWFTPTGWGEALYVPPIARNWFLRSAVAWERAGSAVATPFAGVHIVEATKQVYRAIPARRERVRLVPALEPALAP